MPMQEESTSEPARQPRPHAGLTLAGWLALCFFVDLVSVFFRARSDMAWYEGLIKPRLNPPEWLVGPVWIVLYVLMAVAAWLVWKTRPSACRPRGLGLFYAQLWFNLLWSWIFFSRHQIGLAFVDLVVLWLAILLTIRSFKKMSTTASWLLVPYLAWVTFAGYLNFALWRLS